MKKYCIYVLDGDKIKRISAPGFDSEAEAETHLLDLIEKRENEGHNIYFERNWYRFVILPTYRSKHAFYLEDKDKDIREVEGFDADISTLFHSKGITCLHDIEKFSQKQLMRKFSKTENFDSILRGIVRKYLLSLKY